MPTQVVLEARDLVVSRGAALVLDGVNVEVMATETVAISGPSGSGKSTLLAALAGLVTSQSGRISVDGVVQSNSDRQWAATRRRKIGVVFQGDEFLPELTLTENVCLARMLQSRTGRVSDYVDEAAELFRRLGIDGLGHRTPSDVSVGQLQRAAIARAVLGNPPIILADEPTSALDQESSREALELLLGLAEEDGAAVLIVTHDPAVAGLCNRRLHLENGTLEEPRTTELAHRA